MNPTVAGAVRDDVRASRAWGDYCAGLPRRWRLIVDPPRGADLNMALDQWLLEHSTEPTLRLYGWEPAALSLGRFQSCEWLPESVPLLVRRPSGGRAVYHHHEITYSVLLPGSDRLSVRESFCGLARDMGQALRELGIPAETCARDQLTPSRSHPSCLAVTRAGEVTVGGRKLVGSAQVRQGGRTLQHGSLSRRLDRGRLVQLFGEDPGCADLAEFGHEDLPAERLAEALSAALKVVWRARPWDDAEIQAAERLRARFRLAGPGKFQGRNPLASLGT